MMLRLRQLDCTPDQLFRWRTRLDLTQCEAAKLLGCGERNYRYYESGETTIPFRLSLAVASYEHWPDLQALIPAILAR